MLPLVYPLITGDPAASAIVGDRVYRHGFAPEGVADPYVTWVSTGSPENTLSDAPLVDGSQVQVDVWASGDQVAEDAAKAVRNAIERRYHMTSFSTGRDAVTLRYRISMTFRFWTHR